MEMERTRVRRMRVGGNEEEEDGDDDEEDKDDDNDHEDNKGDSLSEASNSRSECGLYAESKVGMKRSHIPRKRHTVARLGISHICKCLCTIHNVTYITELYASEDKNIIQLIRQ